MQETGPRRDGLRARLVRLAGIARSLAIYYGKPGRGRRERGFFRAFLGPGDLAFDVGAHVGSRTRSWRRLGARVVAVEPQPQLARLLRWLFRDDPGVTVLECALGAQSGVGTLIHSPGTPTVSTLSAGFVHAAGGARAFRKVRWSERRVVQVTTLDALVELYGTPTFCKIDVEGFEPQVLAGLSRPLPALSVEYLDACPEAAVQAVRTLERLASYRFNACPGESLRWALPMWTDAAGMAEWLGQRQSASGDVYAVLPERLQVLRGRLHQVSG